MEKIIIWKTSKNSWVARIGSINSVRASMSLDTLGNSSPILLYGGSVDIVKDPILYNSISMIIYGVLQQHQDVSISPEVQ